MMRGGEHFRRTLEHLKETLQKFQTQVNGDIEKAKDYMSSMSLFSTSH